MRVLSAVTTITPSDSISATAAAKIAEALAADLQAAVRRAAKMLADLEDSAAPARGAGDPPEEVIIIVTAPPPSGGG